MKRLLAAITVVVVALSVLLLISELRRRALERLDSGASFETSVDFAQQLQECRAEAAAAEELVRQLRHLGALCRYDLGVERRLCTDEITDLEERLAAEFELNQREKQDVRNP